MSNIQITKLSSNLFTHIIHISDTHIRPNERHDEFRHVFNKLYESIKVLKSNNLKAIIVLTGDIFDNTNRFLPDQYELCNNFFDNLSAIYPLIVIAGNHDMKDFNRLDSITPSAYSRPNFYYLPKSGAYEYGNVVFVVNSLYDNNQEFIKRVNVTTTKKCIALYHGTIDGSTTFDNHTIKNDNNNRFKSKNDFIGYDAVLLGDIHKTQHITSTIAYAGSLVQQNYGEFLRGHGYLLWDLNNMSTNFYDIKSDYGMVTIHIDNNVWTNNNIEFPKKVSIRCFVKKTIESKRIEIIKSIEKNTEILDVIVLSTDQITLNAVPQSNTQTQVKDPILQELSDPNMAKLHSEYMAKIKIPDNKQTGYLWYPNSLKFKNLFGYAGNHENKIDFATGITSITAPNATGKTSIMNILLFGIFNRLLHNPGNATCSDILNNQSSNGFLELTIQHGATSYFIKKNFLKRKNGSIDIEKNITYSIDNKPYTLTAKLFDEKVNELFGDITDFYKCNILNNRDQSNDFFMMTDTKKIEYLRQIFHFKYFDDLIKLNKDNIKNMEMELSNKKGIRATRTQEIESIIKGNPNYLESIEENIEKLKIGQNLLKIDMDATSDHCDSINKILTIKEKEIVSLGNVTESQLTSNIQKLNDIYPNFATVYDINILKTELAIKESSLNSTINTTEDKLNKELKQVSSNLNKLKNIEKSKLPANDLYKLIIQKETQQTNLKRDIQILKTDLKKNIQKDITITHTKSELIKKIDLIQKQYKPQSKLNISQITKRLNDIKKELTKYQNCNSNIEDSIARRALLTEELKSLSPDPIECPHIESEITKSIADLTNKLKQPYSHNPKKPINLTQHHKNLQQETELQEQIFNLQKNDLTTYIHQLDAICAKNTITKADFAKAKSSLFEPLKLLLQNIKKGENIQSEQLDILTAKLSQLIQQNDMNKSIIKENSDIDNIINKNREIDNNNNKINLEISELNTQSNYLKYQKFNEELTKINQDFEYHKLSKESIELQVIVDNIKHNTQLDLEIQNYKDQLSQLEYVELIQDSNQKTSQLTILTKELSQFKSQHDIFIFEKSKSDILDQLQILNNNKAIRTDMIELKSKINYEMARQDVARCNENLLTLKKNKQLGMDITIQKKELNIQKENLSNKQNNYKDLFVQESKFKNESEIIKHNTNVLNETKKMIEDLETKLKTMSEYGELISPKKLQSRLISKELKKLETTMNDIIKEHTNYSVEINCDGEKIKITTKTKSGEQLSIERLSTYETLILTTAFKRAIGKHSDKSRSKLYLIDESVENMDKENFEKVLPKLMKLILEEYSYIIIVSQRDIKHISDNEIKISKVGEISKII